MNPITTLLKSIWQLKVKKRPVVLSHEINTECNLKCSYCNYWRKNQQDTEMTTEETKQLLNQASSYGIILYNMWAAEPLLRNDLPEILGHAHKKNLLTSMVTNGTLLTKKIKENQLNHLDYLSVSMDGLKTNIDTRGVKTDKIIDGIKKAKEKNIMTSINCVITQKNLYELPDLVKLAEKLDTYISFEPVYRHEEINQETWSQTKIKNKERYREIINQLIKLKKEGYPVINSKTYLKLIKDNKKIKKCSVDDMILHVTANGDIKKCRAQEQVLGNIKNGIKKQWEQTREERKKIKKECSGCPFFGYVESNLIRNLKPEPIINAARYI